MRWLLGSVRIRSNIVAIAAGGILIGVIGLFIGVNYLSQVELRKSALEQLSQETEKSAMAMTYFFSERKNDLNNLVVSRTISAFFENMALGMSMRYGLQASLRDISEIFNRLVADRKLGENRIYTKMAFIDSSGRLLVDSQLEMEKQEYKWDWKMFLTPESPEAAIIVVHDERLLKAVVSTPYFFKNRYSGQIIAEISPQAVYNLAESSKGLSKRCVCIVERRSHFPLSGDMQYETAFCRLPDIASVKTGKTHRFEAVSRDGARMDILAIRVPVKETPLFLVTLLPASEVFGRMSPWAMFWAMGVLAIVILGVIIIAIRTNTHKLILHTRLEEASKKEKEIEEKNRQLGREIAIREQAEKALRKAHDELEVRVKERTAELAKTNKELQEKIAEHMEAEKALRESEERFRQVAESTEEWIWEVDANALYTYASPVVEKLLGYKPEELVGKKHSYDLFCFDDIEPLKKATLELFAEKKPLFKFINQNMHKNGRIVYLSTSGVPIIDEKGKLLGYRGADIDITERKRAEEELKKYSEQLEDMVEKRTRELRDAQEQLVRREKLVMLGQLSGSVGHELRNPMGVISNAVYYLQMTLSDADETTMEYLNIISSEVRNSEKIVSDLLNFSRTRVGTAEREETAVSSLVERVLEKQPPPENVEVTMEIPSDLPFVYVDPRQMDQVLVNLVTNACQAMPEGGRLTLRAADVQDKVHLIIADTGCGISRENVVKIFEPLFTTRARGIGLGLAVSRNLVEVNGGSIDVESEEGKGTTFTVILPTKEMES